MPLWIAVSLVVVVVVLVVGALGVVIDRSAGEP